VKTASANPDEPVAAAALAVGVLADGEAVTALPVTAMEPE
jgi:hypothetical protein